MVAEHTRIQEVVDGLAVRLGRPTAIDDPDFRLLFHSPQHGPLDEVRVRSILDRDSPSAAKDWVRAQGVADAHGVQRLPGAEDVGMLPRAYTPIRHDGRLLGFLWIIDAEATLGAEHDEEVQRAARDVAPLLYRQRARDVLDRHRRRVAVLSLLDESAVVRDRAVRQLVDGQVVRPGTQVVALVVEVVVEEGAALTTSDTVALEMAIERTRARTTDHDVLHAIDGAEAVVILGRRPGATGADADVVAASLQADLAGALRPHRVVVGRGMPRPDVRDVRDSHVEAVLTARALARVPALGDVLHHDALGAHAVLARLPDEAVTPQLVPASVRRLLGADEPDLHETLAVFLDRAGDVAATAAALHVHRSTVYGRLRRIEQLSGRRLDDGEARLELQLGLAVARWVR